MIDVVMPTCRPRLQEVIQYALDGLPHRFLSPDADLRNKRVLFALAADAEGMDAATLTLLRRLRGQESAMEGSLGAVISDGEGEFYTKQLAQDFVLAANAAGCYTMAGASLLLSLFNLLPIPPLDGGRVLDALLPSHPARLAVSYFASCLVICAGLYAGLRQNGWGLLLVGLFLTLGQQTGLHFHPIRGRIELLSEEK